ncbi:hypothetical protein ACUTA3_18395 [Acinetobacter baumannii]|nr:MULTISPECIES: hypothetical protein [Acinetobacter]AYX98576.1 hypothetical protein EGY13_19490 [Acinetobacter sp. FDAARGOS_493]EHU1230668.1 hypothetical protein [Acinetobacter baumannii]EHU1234649.1 hypothetical protein [Acinetobacter baumannii]EHU1246942.1 hypothetical protein [Acinetobacter baumannii]EHU1296302.1 hypothetical protein [Acinetobacter baumannii]
MSKNYAQIIGISNTEIDSLKRKIEKTCSLYLDKAEFDWKESDADQLLALDESKAIALEHFKIADNSSLIPGHEKVNAFSPKVDEFIAIVCDIRDSTKRLSTIDHSIKIKGIQRIFYETSALLPSIEITINHFGGKVTEYLGDGVLGFIQYKDTEQIYKAHKVAKSCLSLTLDIVNQQLKQRYNLPPLQIGIGMALSKAMIRVVTADHVKAFGECVWKASKLSSGRNKACMDDNLKAKWPKTVGGRLVFKREILKSSDINAYRVFPLLD